MRSAHALWRPVAYHDLHARSSHRAALIHSNGGGSDKGSLFGWWAAGARGDHGPDNRHVGAQFQVKWNGDAEQYVDSDLVVYHAYSASEWAFGIEVQDDGEPTRPMTDAQLATIVAILREHHVPGRLLASPNPSDGVGYHEQFVEWNHERHGCPGKVREHQIRTEIIPALPKPSTPHIKPPAPPTPTPVPTPVEEDNVKLIQVPGDPQVFVTDFITKRHVTNPAERDVLLPLLADRTVHEVPAAVRDAIPTVGGK